MIPELLETIKIEHGIPQNLAYHQIRFDKSRKEIFGITDSISLSSLIEAPNKSLLRCRIIYAENIKCIEYLPYKEKPIHKLKIVTSDICYSYKYTNRNALEVLLKSYPSFDEVIIEQEGLLMDTTISNLAFYDGHKWLTPKKPLLEGTMRAKLLYEKKIYEKDIKKEDLPQYAQIALMNSMLGFKILKNCIIQS